MDWIVVRNTGELERGALVLMGASTKRGEQGKIGMFGTGAKYALAVLLRHKVPVLIWSGTRRVELQLEPVTFRGKEFQRIIVVYDGESLPTSITLEVGPLWTQWMALREILANAVDEGLVEITQTSDPETAGRTGTTAVLIGITEDIQEVWKNKDELIRLDKTCVFECNYGRLYDKFSPGVTRIYKNRVLVGKYENLPSLWDYDLFEAPITEDRRVQLHDAARCVEPLVGQSTEVASQVLDWVSVAEATKSKRPFEAYIMSSYYALSSDVWLRILDGYVMASVDEATFWKEELTNPRFKVRVLPQEWIDAIQRTWPESAPKTLSDAMQRAIIAKVSVPRDRGERAVLKRALQIMKWAKFEIDVPVEVVEFQDETILGRWDNKARKILVARKVLGLGVRETLKVLVEEWAHKCSGAPDYTRQFESFLVSTIVDAFLAKRYAM